MMSSKKAPKDVTPTQLDDLDTFFLDGDLDDDPFAPSKDSNKRKGPGDLNVDEEVSVAKKARVPRVKLDQERLLSEKGITALRKRARKLNFKGKGHEWGDASRLLSFYQDWLDDLFPKAKFVDALAMVEKAGHNKKLQHTRAEWINEGRPKTAIINEGGDVEVTEQTGDSTQKQADRIAPIFDRSGSDHQETPGMDDLFGDEDDIYNATPLGARRNDAAGQHTGDEPDEDELDALMAMEGDIPSKPINTTKPSGGAVTSIFGDGRPKAVPPTQSQADEFDELDALLAEAEDRPRQQNPVSTAAKNAAQPAKDGGAGASEEDDLDALIAEAEAHSAPKKPLSAAATQPQFDDDDEEAMAEMDGLW